MSGGGREAEIEAVARAMRDYYDRHGDVDEWEGGATIAIDALDAVRPTGSAARNQEEKTWHIHVCPKCGTRVNGGGEDPPACGMHFPERVEAVLIEVAPVAARSPQDEDHEEKT